ncbi:MAG: 4Fe-4S binding protein [Anaerolineae bacterium]|nr:4Fe-4S binding protein [Anaerolineae bacterium]
MGRPLWFVSLLKALYPARHTFARLTRLPLIGQITEAIFFDGDHVVCLPNDRLIPIGEAVDLPDSVVLPSHVVEHFVEQSSYRWIMNECICRAGANCQDYPHDLGCLFMGEAVLQINPKLGRLVSKEEALVHLRRAREAGLVHMVGRNKMDTIWLGAQPGDKLLTICHCCPCCCLWSTIPEIHPVIGNKIERMPGLELRVTERCVGCGLCEGVCFVDAIRIVDGRAQIGDACRGCGRCVELCPQGAIELSLGEGQPMQQTIERLSSLVDVTSDDQRQA